MSTALKYAITHVADMDKAVNPAAGANPILRKRPSQFYPATPVHGQQIVRFRDWDGAEYSISGP